MLLWSQVEGHITARLGHLSDINLKFKAFLNFYYIVSIHYSEIALVLALVFKSMLIFAQDFIFSGNFLVEQGFVYIGYF